MKTGNSKGGALLYTMIISFLASLISVTFLSLSLAQYNMADAKVKRDQSYQEIRGCLDFAHGALCNGASPAVVSSAISTLFPDVTFSITYNATTDRFTMDATIQYLD